MKTLFLKNGMPIATAVLAIAGAFATTSMQSSSSADQLIIGHTIQQGGVCDIAVSCSDDQTREICRFAYPAGKPAFATDPVLGTCVQVLYRSFP